jgi:hypothetical protein
LLGRDPDGGKEERERDDGQKPIRARQRGKAEGVHRVQLTSGT